jgi:hypothetical protein
MFEKVDDTMTSYVSAVEQFRESATQFMQHVNLLAQAREAYQQAMTTSAEIRTMLDASDESLRTLMAQLEHALNLHAGKGVLDRKRPEAVKAENPKTNGESLGGVRGFP